MDVRQMKLKAYTVNITDKYKVGDALTLEEADALNQTRREDIGNVLRAKINAADEKGEPLPAEEVQGMVDEAAEKHKFGGGGSRLSPRDRCLRDIAENEVNRHLATLGVSNVKAWKETSADNKAWYDDAVAAVKEDPAAQKEADRQANPKLSINLGSIGAPAGDVQADVTSDAVEPSEG